MTTVQGCQIFLGTKYQNREKYQITTKDTKMSIKYTEYPLKRPNVHKIYLPYIFHSKPSKIYPNLDFWFENIPSGNPAAVHKIVCDNQ
jgi:hypothetical protein